MLRCYTYFTYPAPPYLLCIASHVNVDQSQETTASSWTMALPVEIKFSTIYLNRAWRISRTAVGVRLWGTANILDKCPYTFIQS